MKQASVQLVVEVPQWASPVELDEPGEWVEVEAIRRETALFVLHLKFALFKKNVEENQNLDEFVATVNAQCECVLARDGGVADGKCAIGLALERDFIDCIWKIHFLNSD